MKIGPKHLAWAGLLLWLAGIAWAYFAYSQLRDTGLAYEYGSPAMPYPAGAKLAARSGIVLLFVALVWTAIKRRLAR